MSAAPIQCVLFDYGLVLCPEQDPRDVDELARLCGLSVEEFLPLYHESRIDYDQGGFDGVEYWRRFNERLGKTPDRRVLERLSEVDTNSWSPVDAELVVWIDELRRAGIRTGVLSNMPVDQAAHLRRIHGWMANCDHLFFSGEIGLIKPDRDLYRYVLDAIGLSSKSILFVDDRQINIEGAADLGIVGFHYRSNAESLESLKEMIKR